MSRLAHQTLTRLKEALSQKGDLPSMSATLTRIVSSMKSAETDTDDRLVQAVLGDVALTQKVLRLANSSMYSAFGGSVTTVSKAIFILGTETIGHLALGLKLIDNFGQAADTEIAQRELSMAVMSGVIARKLGSEVVGANAEEVAVAALLRCTGRLLVCAYLPEDYKALESAAQNVDEEDAAAQAKLGLSFAEIAQHMADLWGLPSELRASMGDSAADPGDHQAWVQAVAGYSRRYVSAVSLGASAADLAALAGRYAEAVGRPASELVESAGLAFSSSDEAFAKNALARRDRVLTPVSSASEVRTTLQKLVAGLAEAQSVEGSMKAPQLTGLVAELLWDAFGCTRALFFLRRPAHKSYDLMLGYGEGVTERLHAVRFEEAFSPNVFHVALSNAASVYLANTRDANIARRIPSWLQDSFGVSRTMLLIPLVVDKAPVGLLYLDWGVAGRETPLSEAELRHVEGFRALLERSFASARRAAPQVAASATRKAA